MPAFVPPLVSVTSASVFLPAFASSATVVWGSEGTAAESAMAPSEGALSPATGVVSSVNTGCSASGIGSQLDEASTTEPSGADPSFPAPGPGTLSAFSAVVIAAGSSCSLCVGSSGVSSLSTRISPLCSSESPLTSAAAFFVSADAGSISQYVVERMTIAANPATALVHKGLKRNDLNLLC